MGAPPATLLPPAPASGPSAAPRPAPAGSPASPAGFEPPAPSAAAALPVDPDERRAALEPLRREVLAGLADLKGRIAHCGVPRATLHVALQALDGSVRIVDTRIEALPPSGDPRATSGAEPADERIDHCLRSALAGNEIGAPSARPGRRWEMPFDTGSWE